MKERIGEIERESAITRCRQLFALDGKESIEESISGQAQRMYVRDPVSSPLHSERSRCSPL